MRKEGVAIDDQIFLSVRRLRGDDLFTYGELVALSGDFYGSPAELYEERPSPVPWLWEANDVSDLRSMFAVELKWIEDRQRGRRTGAYPDNNVRMAWNAKAYVELALRNTDHFGWHNQLAYCRWHGAALDLAMTAASRNDETWARALVYNAFADHFLTDGFAAGHIRVPRAELRSWAEGRGWSDKLAGALSKLLHDQDGHVETLHGAGDTTRGPNDGLAVRNSKRAAWRTFCDGQLFLFPGAMSQPEVYHPVQAVAESVRELVLAWKKRALPKAGYRALLEVPFPDADAPGLAEKFGASTTSARLDALMQSVAWYSEVPWLGPGLKREHVVALFAALPELMKRLRANIAADCERDPTLEARMPKPYVDAFKAIR